MMASGNLSQMHPVINDTLCISEEIKAEDPKVSVLYEDHLAREDPVSGLCVGTKETETSTNSSHAKRTSRTFRDSHLNEVIPGGTSISKVGHKSKSTDDIGVFGDRASKKAKVDCSAKLPEEPSLSHPLAVKDKDGPILQKTQRTDTNDTDMLQASQKAGSAYDDKTKSKPLHDPPSLDKGLRRKVKLNEKASKLSNGTAAMETAAHSSEKNFIPEGQELEVKRKPKTEYTGGFYQHIDIVLLGS